jgi:hypothetical protein
VYSNRAILAAVIREAAKCNATHGDFADIYKRVGQRMGLKSTTMRKNASIARKRIKAVAGRAFRDHPDRETKVTRAIANYLDVPQAAVKSYF